MGLQEIWRRRWPQWPLRFSLVPGLLALLVFGGAALYEATSRASPRDYAEGVPGSFVVLHQARWLDLGPEPVDVPSLSPLPANAMEKYGTTVALPHHLSKNLSRAMPVWELSAVKRPAFSSRPLISLLEIGRAHV